jgi:hypothetical protein
MKIDFEKIVREAFLDELKKIGQYQTSAPVEPSFNPTASQHSMFMKPQEQRSAFNYMGTVRDRAMQSF